MERSLLQEYVFHRLGRHAIWRRSLSITTAGQHRIFYMCQMAFALKKLQRRCGDDFSAHHDDIAKCEAHVGGQQERHGGAGAESEQRQANPSGRACRSQQGCAVSKGR